MWPTWSRACPLLRRGVLCPPRGSSGAGATQPRAKGHGLTPVPYSNTTCSPGQVRLQGISITLSHSPRAVSGARSGLVPTLFTPTFRKQPHPRAQAASIELGDEDPIKGNPALAAGGGCKLPKPSCRRAARSQRGSWLPSDQQPEWRSRQTVTVFSKTRGVPSQRAVAWFLLR